MNKSMGSEHEKADAIYALAVVNALGGIRPAAKKLGLPVTTVQGWKNRQHIPENRLSEVEQVLRDLGLDIENSAYQNNKDKLRDLLDDNSAKIAESSSSGQINQNLLKTNTVHPSGEENVEPKDLNEKSQNYVNRFWSFRFSRSWKVAATIILFFAIGGFIVLVTMPELYFQLRGSVIDDGINKPPVVNANPTVKSGSNLLILKNYSKNQRLLETRLNQLEAHIGTLERKLSNALISETIGVNGDVSTLRSKVDKFSKEVAILKTENRFDEGLDKIETLIKSQNALELRFNDLTAQRNNLNHSRTVLNLLLGQLETMIRLGQDYTNALKRLKQEFTLNASILKVIDSFPRAPSGIMISTPFLLAQFKDIRQFLASGRPPPGGWNIMEGAWAQVKAVIGLRRVGIYSTSPITLTEQAIEKENWAKVPELTEGYGIVVDEWRKNVDLRLRLESSLDSLQKVIFSNHSGNPALPTKYFEKKIAQ